ncbi:Disease resistance protein [Quillaja saponaria]|uniref:Disease resistance protein n=1 Tax=Quillaja saponaria TaxID=32244 RepID=A0AAD7PQ41_QUISA|nr:Disease resistance protein [Quillaja saponaria]
MDIVINIAGTVVEYTVGRIAHQLGYLFFYKNNVKELQTIKGNLQKSVDDYKRKGEEIVDDVGVWLKDANELLEKTMAFNGNTAGCSKLSCPNLGLRHQLSRKATKMTQEISKFQNGGKYDGISYPKDPQKIISFVTTDYQAYKSREEVLAQILEALRDPNVHIVGVHGLGGVGKTTLVEQVGKKAKEDKLFDAVVMATVKQNPDMEKVQMKIAEMLGFELKGENEILKASNLIDRLNLEKTVLVILDDIWERLDLRKIGIPNDHKGCKILITSRSKEVLSSGMGSNTNFPIGVLSEEESRELFRKMAELDGSKKSSDFLSLGDEIVSCCGGLPIAIVTVARALRKKKLSEWKDALRQLKNNSSGMEDVNASIQLSYDYLGSSELKSICLLCAVLGNYVDIEDLMKYGKGLGILQGGDSIENARSRLCTLVSKLKASYLLLDGYSSNFLTMHDVVRDFAISIAFKHEHIFTVRYSKLDEWPDEDQMKDFTKIILEQSDVSVELPEELKCPNLDLFLISNPDLFLISDTDFPLRIPDGLFKGTRGLKVLVLTAMSLSSLPTSLALLSNLQTLRLDRCKLEDISLIGELKNLKILTLLESEIKQLPPEMKQLTKLQLLDLKGSKIENVIPSKVLASLKNLEELNMERCNVPWTIEEDQNNQIFTYSSLEELNHMHHLKALNINIFDSRLLQSDLSLGKLERYKILIGDSWYWFDEYDTSKTLKLSLDTDILPQIGVKTLMKTVEVLHLEKLFGVKNLLYDLNEDFPKLKYLRIQNNAEIEYVINSSMEPTRPHNVFPMLESLILSKLSKLEKIWHVQRSTTTAFFSELRTIRVEGCPCLKNLFSFWMVVRGLTQLTEMEIKGCNSVEEIIVLEEREEIVSKNDSNDKIEFPELLYLRLDSLPMLIGFSFHYERKTSLRTPQSTSSIQSNDEIVREDELGSDIPLFDQKVLFPKLETLEITSLKRLTKIWHQQELIPPKSFRNLKKLTIDSCEKLVTIFPSHMPIKEFQTLQTLSIRDCGSLEEIFDLQGDSNDTEIHEDGVVMQLKTLELKRLPKLKHIWNYKDCHGNLQCVKEEGTQEPFCCKFELLQLTSFLLKDLSELVNFYPGKHILECPQLKELKMEGCNEAKVLFTNEAYEEGQLATCHQSISSADKKSMQRLRHDISSAVFSFSIRSLNNLEELVIGDCHSLGQLFNMDGHIGMYLKNLTSITITNCPSLRYLFTSAMALGLAHLQRITIKKCSLIEEIIRMPIGIAEAEEVTVDVEKVFPQLMYLHLESMTLLKSFYVGSGTFLCPILKELILRDCPKFKAFVFTGIINNQIMFPKLEEFSFGCRDTDYGMWYVQFSEGLHYSPKSLILKDQLWDESSLFPFWFLERFHNLNQLHVKNAIVKEFYLRDQGSNDNGEKNGCIARTFSQLKKLNLSNLGNLKVSFLFLAPSWRNLTVLRVTGCDGLLNLISSSTAKSLVELKFLSVTKCEQMVEIIANEGGDEEAEVEIVFYKLKYLVLKKLKTLASFYSGNYALKFPALEKLIIVECPQMNIFSRAILVTPILERIELGINTEYFWKSPLWKDNWETSIDSKLRDPFMLDWFWEDNLNTTLQELYEMKSQEKDEEGLSNNEEMMKPEEDPGRGADDRDNEGENSKKVGGNEEITPVIDSTPISKEDRALVSCKDDEEPFMDNFLSLTSTIDSSEDTRVINTLQPSGEMVDFHGLCQVDKSFMFLLDEANCTMKDQLIECQRRHPLTFRQLAYASLGHVLFLLKNIKIKDMVHHRDELELFWEATKAMKFDLEWLSPIVERALSSTTVLQKASSIGKLQEKFKILSTEANELHERLKVIEQKMIDTKDEISLIENNLLSLGIKDVSGCFM